MSLVLSTPLLARLQTDPVQDIKTGDLIACSVQAYFGQSLIDDSTTPPTVTPQPWPAPTVIDYVKDAAKTVKFTAGGKDWELPYGVIGAGLVAAATQERGQ